MFLKFATELAKLLHVLMTCIRSSQCDACS